MNDGRDNGELVRDVERFALEFPWIKLNWTVRLVDGFSIEQTVEEKLRGAVGDALWTDMARRPGREACERAHEGCPRRTTCPFMQLFKPVAWRATRLDRLGADVPAPLIVRGPPEGPFARRPESTLEFSFILVGSALAEADSVTRAVRTIGQLGFDNGRAGRVRFTVERVTAEDAHGERPLTLAPSGELTVPPLRPGLPPLPPTRGVTMSFLTSSTLRKSKKELLYRREIQAGEIIRALSRRTGRLADQFAPELPQPDWSRLCWQPSAERPLRLKFDGAGRRRKLGTQMTLGAGRGWIRWPEVPPEFAPLLRLGVVVNLGAKGSLGLGRYRLLPQNENP